MKGNFFILSSLGYNSYQDFFNTILLNSNLVIVLCFSIFGSLGLFIEDYIWRDRNAVYFLWSLLFIDLVTGVLKAYFIEKGFASRKLPRWGGVVFTYFLLLFLAHNMAKFSPEFFSVLPTGLYGLFLATQFKSIWENLVTLKLIQGPIVNKINNIFNKLNKKD